MIRIRHRDACGLDRRRLVNVGGFLVVRTESLRETASAQTADAIASMSAANAAFWAAQKPTAIDGINAANAAFWQGETE